MQKKRIRADLAGYHKYQNCHFVDFDKPAVQKVARHSTFSLEISSSKQKQQKKKNRMTWFTAWWLSYLSKRFLSQLVWNILLVFSSRDFHLSSSFLVWKHNDSKNKLSHSKKFSPAAGFLFCSCTLYSIRSITTHIHELLVWLGKNSLGDGRQKINFELPNRNLTENWQKSAHFKGETWTPKTI